jgi:hypothetical protein
MLDPLQFNPAQQELLSLVVLDLDGPTSVARLLSIIGDLVDELPPNEDGKPDFRGPELRADVEVCLAALQYLRVREIARRPDRD